MIRLLLTTGFFILLTACANPDYVNTPADSSDGNNNPAEENSGTPASCAMKFPKKNVCAVTAWTATPHSSVYNEFLLELDQAVTPEELSILLWMPSMGHGSAPVKIEPLSPTRYRIHNVFFIMPGDWEIRMYLKEQGATIDQLFVPLMVP